MIYEYIYSVLVLAFLIIFLSSYKAALEEAQENEFYINKSLCAYFKDDTCNKNIKCSDTKLSFKDKTIYIKKFTKKNIFRSVVDEQFKKIFERLKKENISIGEQ